MKYWEIIADNHSKAGWTWGCVANVDREGRTIFVADAHRDDGKRYNVFATTPCHSLSLVRYAYAASRRNPR
jgi:hypothetical protein